MSKNRYALIITTTLSILVTYSWYKYYALQQRVLPSVGITNSHRTLPYKTILYWGSFFGRTDFYFGYGQKIFKGCEYSACFTTSETASMSVEDFDAILFHGREYDPIENGLPSRRSPHQRYIFYILESPFYSYVSKNTPPNFYNWTMNYRLDSDIFAPYGIVLAGNAEGIVPKIRDISKKTKLIAWFVSHCDSESGREKYVKDLSKYIPVDIYGSCGNFKCDSDAKDNCYKMLEREYKFYLSFENSICKDYVTEKLFNVLRYNVVPVVFGAANYSITAPPNSVINTKDFKSPKALADYLHYLDKNINIYMTYFLWKDQYYVDETNQHVLCNLCKKLHKDERNHSYENIETWVWGKNFEMCDKRSYS